jgi:transposase
LGQVASRNTYLRLIRRAPPAPIATPSVLGVDDWALRKGCSYGTILVDLERRRPVALLPGREAETLARWLQDHPGVRVIARDRSGPYADGATRGAPDATQVADRFHILQNLGQALASVFNAKAKDLRVVAQAHDASHAGRTGTVQLPPAPPAADAVAKATKRREWRLAIYQEVWALHRQGWPGHEIAHHLGIGRGTAYRYLRHPEFPERHRPSDTGRSLLDRWQDMILDRWNSGHRNGRQLLAELRRDGYRGSYPTLLRYLRRLRTAAGTAVVHGPRAKRLPRLTIASRRLLTPRNAAALVLKPAHRRTQDDIELLSRLRQHGAELADVVGLAEDFAILLQRRRPRHFDAWLRRAQDCTTAALRRFAQRLASDYDAVRAALTAPWSSGQVEGQINRLKMLKRQMYGRAGLDLLAKRFVPLAA